MTDMEMKMADNVYKGGIPTKPDVDKLIKEFPPKAGLVVSYDEVAGCIGVEPTSNRFKTVTDRWRERVFAETGLRCYTRGQAFRFLTADEALTSTGEDIARISRSAVRARIYVEAIDPAQLTSDEKRSRFFIARREAAALVEAAQKSEKAIAVPPPVSAGVPRLVQSK